MEFPLFCAFLFLFSVINFDVSTGRVHKKDVHSRDLGNDLGNFLDALASFFGNNHENDIEGNQVGEPEPEEPEPEPVPEPEEPEPESECRDGWILGPSKSCYYISPDLKTGTFYDAKRECENLDSDVISIHSASEQMFLDDLLGNHPDLLNPLRKTDFWTSGNQLGRTDNDWQWGDDENDLLSKGYTNWDIANGQPNSPYEKCIFLGHYNRFGLEWHDHRCSYNLATFICETKLAGHENDEEENGGDSIDDEDLHQGSGSGSESGSGSGPEAGWIDDNDDYY